MHKVVLPLLPTRAPAVVLVLTGRCMVGQVKVKRRGDDRKFVAKVLAVAFECDIAMLTVEDEEFYEGVEPVTFGSLPNLQDAVAVVGYPLGGESISVTSGVLLRPFSNMRTFSNMHVPQKLNQLACVCPISSMLVPHQQGACRGTVWNAWLLGQRSGLYRWPSYKWTRQQG